MRNYTDERPPKTDTELLKIQGHQLMLQARQIDLYRKILKLVKGSLAKYAAKEWTGELPKEGVSATVALRRVYGIEQRIEDIRHPHGEIALKG